MDFAVFGPRTRPMLSGQAAAELLGLGKPERGSRRQGRRGSGKRIETYVSECGYPNETGRLEPWGRGGC